MRKGLSGQEKNAQGCILLSGAHWESTALRPVSEASTSRVNWFSGSANVRTGTEEKQDLSSWKAVSAPGVESKWVLLDVRAVSCTLRLSGASYSAAAQVFSGSISKRS